MITPLFKSPHLNLMVFLEWPQSTKWFHKSREKMGYIPRTIVEPEAIDPKYVM